MSRPMNPLATFRSYAYHHILVACDGTDTAEALAEHSEITLFDHERAGRRYAPQKIPNGDGRYIVVINGTSDAAFYIQSASWSSVVVPREAPNGEQQFHTMIADGELTIKEPKGVRFYNLLNRILKDLGTDANGVCFLLKTIFVGIRDDDTTELITNIRPHMFLMYDTSALFDVTGAEYVINFVSITNGAARMPQMSSIVGGVTVNVGKKGVENLRRAIGGLDEDGEYQEGALGQAINQHYEAEWEKLQSSFKRTNPQVRFDEQFRRVHYKFIIDPAYNEFVCGDNGLPSSTDTGDKDTIASYQGGSTSIENLIADIMRTSKAVVTEHQASAATGKKFIFKITSTLETSPTKFDVIYYVERYQAAVVKKDDWLTFTPEKVAGEGRGIEFDYIFTGQNVDVKSFDLKFQMGLVFFQILNAYNNVPAKTSDVTNRCTEQIQTVTGGMLQGTSDQSVTLRQPLFLGATSENVVARGKRLAAGTLSYHALMERQAAIESVQSRLVIHGNPQLLNESTLLPKSILPVGSEPPPVVQTADSSILPEDEKPRRIMPELYKTPGYVKVNVKMPTLWQEDTSQNDFDYPQDYAQDFWYRGWFFVVEIKNVFDSGEFSQELDLVALIADDGETAVGRDEKCSQEPSTNTGTSTMTTTTVDCITEEQLQQNIAQTRTAAEAIAEVNSIRDAANEQNRRHGHPERGYSPTEQATIDLNERLINKLRLEREKPICSSQAVQTSTQTTQSLSADEKDPKKKSVKQRRTEREAQNPQHGT